MNFGTPAQAAERPHGITTMFPCVVTHRLRRSAQMWNCASAQLERHLKILADKTATTRSRNEALKWIVHLVGDIHQPLHASDNADRGGNSVLVRGAANLHSVWDVAVVQNGATQNLLRQPIAFVG